MVWGIEDDTQNVIGTTFNPDTQTKGKQVFAMWLSQMLSPRITFAFRYVAHPKGNLVLLEIPATHTCRNDSFRTHKSLLSAFNHEVFRWSKNEKCNIM